MSKKEEHGATEPVVPSDVQQHIAAIESEPTDPNRELSEDAKKIKKDWTAFKKAFFASKKGKITVAVAGVLVLVGVIFAIPFTRYAVLGLVVKKPVTLTVIDSVNSRPVSEVDVVIGGKSGTTDGQGKVTIANVPVGDQQAKVTKAYYKDASQSVRVPVFSTAETSVTIEATGRQVLVRVINKVSAAGVAKAHLVAGEVEATTDEKGDGVLVVPAGQTTASVAIKAEGYNDTNTELTVTDQVDPKNTFSVVPSGKVYFLSKRTGKIDVMKSDLDGANAEVVLAGTGKENDEETVLLASRDWKYLALKAKRDTDKPKLYYINASNGAVSVIDEGDASFTPTGWSNNYFVYTVERNGIPLSEDNHAALKSYNADTAKLTTLEQTEAESAAFNYYAYQYFNNIFILDQTVVYQVTWGHSWNSAALGGKNTVIKSVGANGDNKKDYKSFAADKLSYIGAVQSEPQEIYYQVAVTGESKHTHYELHNGTFAEAKDITDETFGKTYPTLLVSPSGSHTLWSEPRDGKIVLQVGDGEGNQGKTVAVSEKQTPYGWFSDDYVLITQNSSELYILPRDNPNNSIPLKIADYHRAYFPAYGYGYGGGY